MNKHLQRGKLFLEQERYSEAICELHLALSEAPNQSQVFGMLAVCFAKIGKFGKATEAVEQSIALAPEDAYGHFVASQVFLGRRMFDKAKLHVEEAILISPNQPTYFRQLSLIQITRQSWPEALQAAEQGLAIDANDIGCQTSRAFALSGMERLEEAELAARNALRGASEEAATFATLGAILLKKGNTAEALEHFKEALRLRPGFEFARRGMVEALKGNFLLYRILLSWLAFGRTLNGFQLVGVLIAGYLGYQFCSFAMHTESDLRYLLFPLAVSLIAFVVLTWIASPILNLALRTSSFGRMVLSEHEKLISTIVGIVLLLAFTFLIISCATMKISFVGLGVAWAMIIPLIATYHFSSPGWPRISHTILIGILVLLGLFTSTILIADFVTPETLPFLLSSTGKRLALPFILLSISSQFVIRFLVYPRPR